jgi:hypothetical protein
MRSWLRSTAAKKMSFSVAMPMVFRASLTRMLAIDILAIRVPGSDQNFTVLPLVWAT